MLCTITVNGYHSRTQTSPEHHWKLPTVEPLAQLSGLQRLHTVDLYFWTVQDAENFIGNVRRLLQHDQVELLDVPPVQATRNKVTSPVVQQLENVAIQDSTYQPQAQPGRQETPKSTDTRSYQPLAYNPAAPPAPEPIKHREKTPPPADADAGTGLGAAAYADQLPATSQSSISRPSYDQSAQSQVYVPQPPSQAASAISPNHTPSAVTQRSGSVASLPPPPPLSPPNQGTPSNQQMVPSFSGPPQQANAPIYDQNGKPLPSPSSQVIGNSYVSGSHQPMQHVQPQYADYLGSTGHSSPGPIGGYSNYTYTQKQQQAPQQNDDYGIHGQVYRPTEDEAKRDPRQRLTDATSSPQTGKIDQQTQRVDKGVNRLFKRIEKRIG